MKKGKFIVLEGLDGSGKSTQTDLLIQYLREKNIDSEFIHFPKTDSSSKFYGNFLKRFLKGELGALEDVDPWFVAMLFAGDRRNHAEELYQKINAGKWIVADRYVLSNIAFQGAKLKSNDEKLAIAKWILHTEFEVFNLPKPDKTIFVHMPFSFCQKNISKQRSGDDRNYLDGETDIHENNVSFQANVYEMYKYMLANKEYKLTELDLSNQSPVPAPEEIHKQLRSLIEF